jgi:predicted RNase H-like nuclease
MESTFIGIDVSLGKKPFTVAVLGDGLNIISLMRVDMESALEMLENEPGVIIAVNTPQTKSSEKPRADLVRRLEKLGYKSRSVEAGPRQWFETDANFCYRNLIEKKPLSRRTQQGRIQRGLILHENGLRVRDPMEFFEEITRHRMMMGEFPNELVYSATELDAMISAYVAWMTVNEPEQIEMVGDEKRRILHIPKEKEREPSLI